VAKLRPTPEERPRLVHLAGVEAPLQLLVVENHNVAAVHLPLRPRYIAGGCADIQAL
jgi:hypothetical protein